MEAIIVPALFMALVFAPATAWYAQYRDRPPLAWLVFGAILGPIALALLWVSPPGVCRTCGARAIGWATHCVECGSALDDPDELGDEPLRRPTADGPAETGVVRPLRNVASGTHPRRGGIAGAVGGKVATPMVTARGVSVILADESSQPATVFASGIYTGGSIGLEIGGRYGLGVIGVDFVVLGPTDIEPERIAVRKPIRELTVAAIENQILVSNRTRRRRLVLTFQRLSGMTAAQLEQALATGVRHRDRPAHLVAVGPGLDREPTELDAVSAGRRPRGGPAA